jgi:hypothetical protein
MRWIQLPSTPEDDGDVGRIQDEQDHAPASALPDLDDPATRGALLALVRDRWDDPLMSTAGYVVEGRIRWRIDSDDVPVGNLYDCDTEAEVLVQALEEVGGGR